MLARRLSVSSLTQYKEAPTSYVSFKMTKDEAKLRNKSLGVKMCHAKPDKCVLVPFFCATVHHTQTLIVEAGLPETSLKA